MNYYYANAKNEPTGPLSIEELNKLAEKGEINARTPVIGEGQTQWRTYGEISGKPPVPQASPTSESGPEEHFSWIDLIVGLLLAWASGFVLPWTVIRSAAKELSGWGRTRKLPSVDSDLPVLTNLTVIMRAYTIIVIGVLCVIVGIVVAIRLSGIPEMPVYYPMLALFLGLLGGYFLPALVSYFFEVIGLMVRVANDVKKLRRLG